VRTRERSVARPSWVEWEGKSLPFEGDAEHLVLAVIGHPDSLEELRESLVVELSQLGVADGYGHAHRMADAAVLTWGWQGYVEADPTPVYCLQDGSTLDDEQVDRTLPCVYAYVVR
jgi:hypothetical protein